MKKIIFYDINIGMCDAWAKLFKDIEEIDIQNVPFEDIKATFVVTAGNSFGIMTGGIDLAVRNYFGIEVQDAIQEILFFQLGHKLKVGENIIVNTPDKDKPKLVYAATMEIPSVIKPRNVYLTTYNILKSCYCRDGNIAICGLGVGTGKIPYEIAAAENYKAYSKFLKRIRK